MALRDAADLLRRHATPFPEEAAMADDALAFIAAHPDCLWRTCLPGHLTGSAWIVDPERRRTLLVRHRKLQRWLQPGGHADGDGNLLRVALREAREETGLDGVRAPSAALFDFDRHRIPARGAEPEHWHYDFRFLVEADPAAALVLSDESHDLRWFPLEEVAAVAPGSSLLRMVAKIQASATGA